MDNQSSFEQAIERDIQNLAVEIHKIRERPESQTLSGPEVLKQSIHRMTQTPAAPPTPASASPLPNYVQNATPETKLEIEHLLEMAFREGISKAAAEASKSNPFVLDAFHDALVGKLYPEMQRRGMVK